MKQQKLLLIGLVVLAFAAFFMMQPVREKNTAQCPLTTENINNDPDFARHCTATGKVVKDGKCTCPG